MELTSQLKAKYLEHAGEHVEKYPASCNDLVQSCNNLSEFTSDEKKWFSEALPHGSYRNKDEVKKALHL